jgi:hypothetical protein
MNVWREFAGLTRKLRDELVERRIIQTDPRKRDNIDIKAEFTS